MPSAIVTGATGILGREIVAELGRHPDQWPTVHALSRSKKDEYPENVVHNHIDLTTSADGMTKDLENVRGEYLFFAAYLQKDTEQENWDVNGAMLDNFLQALKKTGVSKSLRRIILVTGAKQYGVHLGVPKNPMEESDPWLTDSKYPPNFYYNQQNILHSFCETNAIEWTVTYPNDVIGFAKGNFMNLATSLGLYASVFKELGQDLEWPGSQTFYTRFDCFTYSCLHAQFCLWAALEPRAANEAFNVVNGDVESWQNMWPKVAKHFGIKVKPDQFSGEGKDPKHMPMAEDPPLSTTAKETGLVGQTSQSYVDARIDLEKWSQRDNVKEAWEKLAERESLEKDAFEKATWGFLAFVFGRNFDLVISMSKARKLGWTGYVDTWDAIEIVFEELEGKRVLPKRT